MKKILLPLILILCLTFALTGYSADNWVSPTSFSDPDSRWSDETNIYDGNLGTYGRAADDGYYVELNIAAISCDKVRVWSTDGNFKDLYLFVDVYYSSAWHNIHSGTVSESEWVEKAIGSTETVTAARIKTSSGDWTRDIYEFEFNDITPAPPADLFSTYNQRIKLTIDHDKIDSDLTHFPITLFMTDSQMEEVFAEFDADEDFDRCAITTGDESTQIYGDCELFDDSEELGVYHVAKTAIVTDADAAGYLYFYYDNDAGHNTGYISKSGGVAAQSVYDGNTKLASHQADATTSTILDSTSNNHDGTKTAANNPNQVTGQVGLAQEFTGDATTNSGIGITDHSDFDAQGDFTIMALVYSDTFGTSGGTNYLSKVLTKDDSDTNRSWQFGIRGEEDSANTGKQRFVYHVGIDTAVLSTNAISVTTWTLIGISFNNTTGAYTFYKNGVADGSASTDITPDNNGADVSIGGGGDTNAWVYDWDGKQCEVRYDTACRSAAWIKATYNSLYDTLLTYGAEETEAVSSANILFIFAPY